MTSKWTITLNANFLQKEQLGDEETQAKKAVDDNSELPTGHPTAETDQSNDNEKSET
jgi:hypothetical protein